MKKQIIMTHHAIFRAFERLGYTASYAKKRAQYAIEHGVCIEVREPCIINGKFRGRCYKIATEKECFVFSENFVCITMYRFYDLKKILRSRLACAWLKIFFEKI